MKGKRKRGCEGSGPTIANPRADRRAERRAGRFRADLVRGDALARLLMKGTIDRGMYAAGLHVRQLCVAARPGIPALDFTRERVQGGRLVSERVDTAMLDAEGELRRLLLSSQIGAEAAHVVMMVCRDDMLLTAIAVDMEEDEETRKQGGHRRETAALVRYLLRTGLSGIERRLARREGRGDVAAGMRAWLAEGARPVSAIEGEREDLPLGRAARD
jgi:hypothetical protein